MRRVFASLLAIATVGVVTPTLAHADDAGPSAFADGVKDYTGEYNRAWVITRLHGWKLGKKCWAKVPRKDQGALHTASFATRDVVEIAKALTGEDWSDIESSNNSDREANKALIEPKLAAFKDRFFVNVSVDGDDCDAGSNSLWLQYWSSAIGAIRKYPPPAGKAFVTLEVSSKTKDLTVDVSADGTTFTIRGPKEIAAKQWNDKLERPFRKLASGLTDDLAFGTLEATGSMYTAWILTKLHTFKVGKKCLAKLGDKEQSAIHTATFVTRDIAAWAKGAGAEDWDAIEGQSANDKQTNRELVARDMDAFRKRFSVTVTVDGDDCDAGHGALWQKYWSTAIAALEDYPPKAAKVAITVTASAKAKAVDVKVGKDGATIAITAPRDKELPGWSDKIEAAFKKVARKR